MPISLPKIQDASKREKVEKWVNGESARRAEARDVLQALTGTEKDEVAEEIVVLAATSPDVERRALLRALASFLPEKLRDRLGPSTPPNDARRWEAADALVEEALDWLVKWLQDGPDEHDPWFRARLARTLAYQRQEAVVHLERMIEQGEWVVRAAACRALREVTSPALRDFDRMRLAGAAVKLVEGLPGDPTLRLEAATTLGKLKDVSVLDALGQVATGTTNYLVRRSCVEAMNSIDAAACQGRLLETLRGADDTRQELAGLTIEGLKSVLGADRLVDVLVGTVLASDSGTKGYLEAARRVDRQETCRQLEVKLMDPKPEVRARAAEAYGVIGTDRLFRAYQASRLEAMDSEAAQMRDTNKRILDDYEKLLAKAESSWNQGMVLHWIAAVVALVAVLAGLGGAARYTTSFLGYTGLGVAGAGFLGLFGLLALHPLRTLRVSLDRTMRSGLMLMTELRRLGHADALYKHVLMTTTLSADEAMKLSREFRQGTRETMDELDAYLRRR